MNKTNIEEDIKMLKELDVGDDTEFKQAIENILADRERLEKENEEMNTKILSNAGIYQLGFKDGQKQNQAKANKYDALVEMMKEKIEEIRKYEEIAGEQIEEKIVIADSDSLNFGRKQAHGKDIEVLQELIPEEE